MFLLIDTFWAHLTHVFGMTSTNSGSYMFYMDSYIRIKELDQS